MKTSSALIHKTKILNVGTNIVLRKGVIKKDRYDYNKIFSETNEHC
jgi:hypothetical protein